MVGMLKSTVRRMLKQAHLDREWWSYSRRSSGGTRSEHQWIPPFDHSLSDEWTARLHDQQILGYVGVYVDDLLIAGPRSLNDLGPDPDCVPVLHFFLGMNLERVDADRSAELELPVGTILLNQMEYIIEVLMKFEPSLQLKVRTTPGNQESFATRNATFQTIH